jgi:hypothetical protein
VKRSAAFVAFALATLALTGPAHAVGNTGTKRFKMDCVLTLQAENTSDGPRFRAWDSGPDCGEYYVRGVRMRTRDAEYATGGAAAGDLDPAADTERLVIGDSTLEGRFLWARVNVEIPYVDRCDRYQLRTGDRKVYFIDSTCAVRP